MGAVHGRFVPEVLLGPPFTAGWGELPIQKSRPVNRASRCRTLANGRCCGEKPHEWACRGWMEMERFDNPPVNSPLLSLREKKGRETALQLRRRHLRLAPHATYPVG